MITITKISLYKLFGVNAELLIDHAWGYEPCTIAEIKAYRPESNSISSGQVLQCPYTCEKARVVVQEMTEGLVLELVEKGLSQIRWYLQLAMISRICLGSKWISR